MDKQPDCRECGTGQGLCAQHVMQADQAAAAVKVAGAFGQSLEKVNHPSHYGGDTTYEHIKVAEAWSLNYALGSATKYICRVGKKGDSLENLKKARFWIEYEIKRLDNRERLDNLLSHTFDGKGDSVLGRCAHEVDGIYCGRPACEHRLEATCEELDCDEDKHSPYCVSTVQQRIESRLSALAETSNPDDPSAFESAFSSALHIVREEFAR